MQFSVTPLHERFIFSFAILIWVLQLCLMCEGDTTNWPCKLKNKIKVKKWHSCRQGQSKGIPKVMDGRDDWQESDKFTAGVDIQRMQLGGFTEGGG